MSQQITEEAYLKKVEQQFRLMKVMEQPTRLTIILLGVNILLWLAAKFYGMMLADQGLDFLPFNAEQLAFYTGLKLNTAIADGQWWRLLSSQYVHLDVMHLAFNGYGIYVLGRLLERVYGWRRMLLIYTFSGTVGALASYFFTPAPAGGASGAVYGLVGALFIFGIKYRKILPPQMVKALTVGFLPWIVLGIGIGFIGSIPLDNAAHIGGLLAGALAAVLLASKIHEGGEKKWASALVWVMASLIFVALAWMFMSWSTEALRCLESAEAYQSCYMELIF